MNQALTIKSLHKTYDNGFQALKGIDLTVHEGDFYALLGPNGAGKSTAIGVVSTLVRKTSGYVEVFGHNLDKDLTHAKRMLGVVPQEFNFNQFEKVKDVVMTQAGYYGIPGRIARQRSEKYLKQLGLWDKRNTMSRMLSGGMKRRLMIARALIHDPKLLILDEPTAGVDIELRRSLWEFVQEINEQGTTIILTTHYLEEAEQLCRNIGIIDKGEIIESTSIKALLSQLQQESFVLDLKEPLTELPSFAGYEVKRVEENSIEVEVGKQQGVNDLFRQLSDYRIEVASMRNKANRLEELFMKMTSAHAQPAVEAVPVSNSKPGRG
ncbi:ABC transporter ATP-binding protein [Endozoicomonas montiporae]|uniref:Putative ABC transporter ATP-binding protein n=1 Tax=Endozoicomonas montiporae CL-33 TaxID=570277 RepID=A0A142BFR6_9GAMM|nr:ABC transporter ATP-binding protein [Endozoicomonas montiporae]AMO57592.1 putative ABC transporter ATP-binding protein [Endozoicomonas montiporae CL-33]